MSETDPTPSDGTNPTSASGSPAADAGGPAPRQVRYKGAPLDAERGPGLGCFWIQLAVLVAAVTITPLSVVWGWPEGVSAALLFLVVLLLLFTGQTVIFLLRLVAADRRAAGRHRPLASATKTVGELEDEHSGPDPDQAVGRDAVPGTADPQPGPGADPQGGAAS